MSNNTHPEAENHGREAKLEDQLRGVMRRRQMSPRTEETYVQWYRRYVRHFGRRHPREMGAEQITEFDSHASSGVSRPAGFASLSLSRA